MKTFSAGSDIAEPLTGPLSANDAIYSAQVACLFRYVTVGVLGAYAGIIVLCAVLVKTSGLPIRVAAIWIAVFSVLVASHILLRLLYDRRSTVQRNWRVWANSFTVISFAEGVCWGFVTLLLAGPDDIDGQVLTLLATCAVTAGAVPAYSSYMPAFSALFFPAMVPYLGRAVLHSGTIHIGLAVMDIIFIVTIGSIGYLANANTAALLRLNIEKDLLTEKLRREKERAEEAYLAKSRFLAAASHDLRQPLHALSLFVGALSAHQMSAEMRRLAGNIEESVNAMDGLFSALLDISKIDAGAIKPHLEVFELQPLLQRLCNGHAVEARAKGNDLKLICSTASVYADLVILERILRNVISNAVRYTDHGRILVGCRRGKPLWIEIHDTGCGIRIEEQERIFDEFYQVKNSERDRTQGLGLGLAIVKRLAGVLDCSIKLSSKPGKGTIFRIGVPVLEAPPKSLVRLDAKNPVASKQGLILVVDDETAIQEGMRSLLSSWGHYVLAAGSCADMIEQISKCPFRADLIICDYRLRDGENGIDVIKRLQSEYNDEIPAILITGDTAPDRIAEAMASGLEILHKPVSNIKLHTAVMTLMNFWSRGSQ